MPWFLCCLALWAVPLCGRAQTVVGDAEEKILYVAPEQVDCTGVGPMRCFQVSETPDGPWTLHYDGFQNFTFEPGHRFKLKVKKEKLDYGGPVADAPGFRWTVVEVLEKTSAQAAGGLDLVCGPTWKLSAVEVLAPPAVEPPGVPAPTLVVAKDGKVSGQSGCNRYFGQAQLDDRQGFACGPLNTTRKLCEPAVMKAEGVFLERMQAVVRYTATATELRLMDQDGARVLVFH
jgi:heat shock protein HslJ